MNNHQVKEQMELDLHEFIHEFKPEEIKDETLQELLIHLRNKLWEVEDYLWQTETLDDDDYSVDSEEE